MEKTITKKLLCKHQLSLMEIDNSQYKIGLTDVALIRNIPNEFEMKCYDIPFISWSKENNICGRFNKNNKYLGSVMIPKIRIIQNNLYDYFNIQIQKIIHEASSLRFDKNTYKIVLSKISVQHLSMTCFICKHRREWGSLALLL